MTVFIYLTGADLNIEVASFIGDLEDFWPGEPVDPEAVSVDEQTIGTHTKHYINSLWILMNIGIERKKKKKFSKSVLTVEVWEYYLCTLAWCRSTPYIESFLAFSRKFTSASAGVIPLQHKYNTWLIQPIRKLHLPLFSWLSIQLMTSYFLRPVVTVKLHHSLLQLTCLIGGKAEVTNIVWAMFLWLVVPKFSLDSVGAQKGVGDKRAG